MEIDLKFWVYAACDANWAYKIFYITCVISKTVEYFYDGLRKIVSVVKYQFRGVRP